MPPRVRRRDVDDTTMGVVEAALADERAAKLKRKVQDPHGEIGLDQPSGRGGENDDPTKLDVGPIDPTISQEMIAKAAKHRSLLRSENAARMRGVENLEAGHAPDENDEGPAFEPFNLDRERREGYFDDDGNYVRNESDADDEKDAWLDDVHADARLSTAGDKLAVREDSENEGGDTTDVDIANIKRELSTYLEAGETVLDALRRLGGVSAGRGNGGKSGGARSHATKSSTSSRKNESSMDAQSKIAFDKVTELSSTLMSNGEYDVYDSRKETLDRAAKENPFSEPAAAPSVPEYAFDEATKLYKCESSGMSYCPKTGGFTDGKGRWWWFDDATQQFVAWT